MMGGGEGQITSGYVPFHPKVSARHSKLMSYYCTEIVKSVPGVPNTFFQDCLGQLQKKSSEFRFSHITRQINVV